MNYVAGNFTDFIFYSLIVHSSISFCCEGFLQLVLDMPCNQKSFQEKIYFTAKDV